MMAMNTIKGGLRRLQTQQKQAKRVLNAQQFRAFSAEEKPAAEQPSQDEIAANKAEWGIKYDDECLKFEKEWKLVADKIDAEQMVYIESELSDLQKKKVDMLVEKQL